MTPFRERNPIPIGAGALIVIFLLLFLAFNTARLPIIGGGTVYKAAFTESSGLKSGDEVRVAGVKIGEVESLELENGEVMVEFRVKGASFGTDTGAAIKIKTVLGTKYLALLPDGPGQLDPDTVIPAERTTPAFDVVEAFTGLADTAGEIDDEQLAAAFETLAAAFEDTPDNVRTSLDGLARLSRTISSRDAQIAELLQHSQQVSLVLANRNREFTDFLAKADILLQEVERRREVISQLLVNTSALAQQLSGLVADNTAQLQPALTQLRQVVTVLQRNQDNLDSSVALLGPFVRLFANTLGNGQWFDTFIVNLVPLPVTPGA